MLKIISIRLRNFRIVSEATFRPLEDGITGLSGANGAGKSSFLAGVLWAIYGVTPDGVPTSGLRRQDSSYDDECSVSVILKHNGQTIEIMRELRGKNNRTIINTYVDGREQTHTTPSAAKAWILNRLKIDAQAFTTAFVIQQKELDSLVKAKPAARRVLIERLSGIEAMSEALKTARKNETEAKRQLDALPGSQEELDIAINLASDQEVTCVMLEEALERLSEKAQQKEKTYRQVNAQHQRLLSEERAYATAHAQLEATKNAFAQSQKSTHAAEKVLEEHKHQYPTLDNINIAAAEQNLNEVKRHLNDAEQALRQKNQKINQIRYEIGQLVSKKESGTQQLAILRDDLQNVTDALAQEPTAEDEQAMEDTLASAHSEADNMLRKISAANEARTSLLESITKLEESTAHEGHGKAECPTCHSPLENPDALIASLRAALPATAGINALQSELESKRVEIQTFQATLQDIKTRRGQHENLLSQQARLAERISNGEAYIKNIEMEHAAKEQEAEGTTSIVEEKELEELRKQYDRAISEWKEIESFGKALRTRSQLQDNAQGERAGLDSLREKLNAQDAALQKMIEVTPHDVSVSANALNETLLEWDEVKAKVHEQRQAFSVAQTRLESLSADVSRQESYMEKKKLTAELLRTKAAVSDLLDEFRKNRVATIAPELSETATAMISMMTSGQYTEVLLDEDFTPSVVDIEGVVRPVSWLSGGEESVVALALRIAIGNLMTGGEGGLLWLDEVLTAQDAQRRNSLLDALRNLHGKQIIMINHTQDAMDMVDRTVTVVRHENGGSTIKDTEQEDEGLVEIDVPYADSL